MEKQPTSNPASRQRLDKWLFFTRLIKSRSLAQKAIEDGRVAVNEQRVTQSSFQVKAGDVLQLALDRRELIVRVLAPGSGVALTRRRGFSMTISRPNSRRKGSRLMISPRAIVGRDARPRKSGGKPIG